MSTTILMGAGTTYHNFFDPSYMNTSSTPQVDITFVFVGIGNYSITQSSFESPCTPLDGGFDSGLVGVRTENSSTAARATLTLGTVGETVWFFSQQSDPDWRCNSSIVGALNPPVTGNLTFASFLVNANATGPTASRPATAATLNQSTVVTRTSSLSETHSVAIATTSTASTSYSPAITGHSVIPGAIVGGALGGAMVVVVALLAVLFFLRERKAHRRTSVRRRSILAQDLEANSKLDPLGTRRKSIPQLDHPEHPTQMNPLDCDPCTNVANFPAVSKVPQRPELSSISPAARNLSESESNVEDPTEASRQRDKAIENSPLIINCEIRTQRLIEHVFIEAERAIAEIRRAQTNASAVILNASSGENVNDGNAHVLFSTPPPSYQLSDALKLNV